MRLRGRCRDSEAKEREFRKQQKSDLKGSSDQSSKCCTELKLHVLCRLTFIRGASEAGDLGDDVSALVLQSRALFSVEACGSPDQCGLHHMNPMCGSPLPNTYSPPP